VKFWKLSVRNEIFEKRIFASWIRLALWCKSPKVQFAVFQWTRFWACLFQLSLEACLYDSFFYLAFFIPDLPSELFFRDFFFSRRPFLLGPNSFYCTFTRRFLMRAYRPLKSRLASPGCPYLRMKQVENSWHDINQIYYCGV
jgi:hypothetical protein